MRTVYKTAHSPVLIIVLGIVISGSIVMSITTSTLLGTVVLVLCGVYVWYVYTNFRYVIENSVLLIKCGTLYSTEINIDEIRKVKETFSIMNQPAGAFRRLEIAYKKFESIQISPKEKDKFMAQLRELNPSIEFHLKK